MMSDETLKVWQITDGPFASDEVCGCEECQEEPFYWVVAKVSLGDSPDVYDEEIMVETFEDAYQFKKVVDESFSGPVEVVL